MVGLCSAVNTWQGQNPSGGAGALPSIAVVHGGTVQLSETQPCFCASIAAVQTAKEYIDHSEIAFLCGIVR